MGDDYQKMVDGIIELLLGQKEIIDEIASGIVQHLELPEIAGHLQDALCIIDEVIGELEEADR